MPLGTILLIILVLLLLGALPSWPYSASWGPYPAGILGVVLIVVLILVLMESASALELVGCFFVLSYCRFRTKGQRHYEDGQGSLPDTRAGRS